MSGGGSIAAADLGALDLVVLAVEVERRLGPGAAHHGEELVGAGVALGLVERWSPNRACSVGSPPVTTLSSSRPSEIRWKAAAICAASIGLMTPGRNATRNFSRVGLADQRGRGQPGVLAPRAGRA